MPRAVAPDAEPAHDRGMGQIGERVGLALQPAKGGGVIGLVGPYDLDDHRGVQDLVEREVGLVRIASAPQLSETMPTRGETAMRLP